ncbi:noelin-2-like [Gigantopelta aegis]|uniref:noelin-2-like n=1 Tax=Gigantopelta aegis TaxID=1735272 RepID=UPI001B88C40E|nr:noelin-2-like [Gigantopelta aegis]
MKFQMLSTMSGYFKVALLLVGFETVLTKPIKNDQCEYNVDLVGNTIKVVCHGKNARISIYANNADMKTGADYFEDVDDNRNRNTSTKKTAAVDTPASLELQRDHAQPERPDSYYVKPVGQTIRNSTRKMEKLKKKLSKHAMAMGNITELLTFGDEGLRSDLEIIRRMHPNTLMVKEAMLAAIKNQYSFMRTAILTQNAELSKMMESLQSLIDVIMIDMRSYARSEVDLVQQIRNVNQTMLTMRRMLSNEFKKSKNKMTDNQRGTCPQEISAIGHMDSFDTGYEKGAFMKDAASKHDRVYVMNGANLNDRLLEFDTELDLEYELMLRTHDLPFQCQGTGHVVYRGYLFCQTARSPKIVKYHLKRMERSGVLNLENAGIGNTYPYQFGDFSDVDLAVDENGLWVIYATPDSAGKIIISKLNDEKMEIEKTWLTSFPKGVACNTFMVCGVLYAASISDKYRMFIRYVFDTNTLKDAVFNDGRLVFPADGNVTYAESVMLDYDSKDGRLYSWNNRRVDVYQVYLKTVRKP